MSALLPDCRWISFPDQGRARRPHPHGHLPRRAVPRLRMRRRGLRRLHRPAGVPEIRGQAHVLRVASNFTLAPATGTALTCAEAVKKLLKRRQGWEVRSAGTGSKGERWYAWAWLATASPQHCPLVRRHLKTGELAFHYCFVPGGQSASKPLCPGGRAALARGRGLRAGKKLLRSGPVPSPALHRDPAAHRAGHGRFRGLRRHRRPAQGPHQHPGPASRLPQPQPPPNPGLIPLTIREIRRLLASAIARPKPPGHAARWLEGDAATRHDPAGSTNLHACSALGAAERGDT